MVQVGVPWFILVLTAAIPLLLGALAWLAYRRPGSAAPAGRGGAPGSEPACAACGYAVTGLPSYVCPECGSDLRDVGVRDPAASDPRPLHVPLTVWLLIVLGAAVLAWDFVRPRLPVRYGSFDRILLTPSSNAYRVELWAFGSGWRRRHLRTDVEIIITPHSGGPRRLYLRPGQPPVMYDPAGRVITGNGLGPALPATGPAGGDAVVTPQVVLSAMLDAGIDTDNPLVQTEAAELSRYVNDNLGPAGWGSLAGSRNVASLTAWSGMTVWSRNLTSERPDWVLWCAGAGWLLVWMSGAAVIVTRRRRSRRRLGRARAVAVFLPPAGG